MKKIACLAFLLLGLTACSRWDNFFDFGPATPTTPAAPSSYLQLSPSAPPAAMQEERPVNPDPLRYEWRTGYWSYGRGSFDWVSGQFIERPHPTAIWSPDRWERRQFGWAFIPGFWQ